MLYMVIERFKPNATEEIYRRFRERGRLLPQGLEYVSSWLDLDFSRCFQLMQTEDVALFDLWVEQWQDLVDFEIVHVRTSAEASAVITPRL